MERKDTRLQEYPFNSTKINVIHVSNDSARVIINIVPIKVTLLNCDEGLRRKTSSLETL